MAYPTGELSVDLRAIAENWRYVNALLHGESRCSAVVKANAYGLGVDRVAPKLYHAGCRDFFVSNLKEAMQLQSLVGRDATVFVLCGCSVGSEEEFIRRGIVPVIVSSEMLIRWAKISNGQSPMGAVLKVDTGMGRLGLTMTEIEKVIEDRSLLQRANINCLMSHFACADIKDHSLNAKQVSRFAHILEKLRPLGIEVSTSLANSSAIFLGSFAHCDIVRAGIALYGGNPGLDKNPMQAVVGLDLPIIQVKTLASNESVGYGATQYFNDERIIAVASGGYADGILRSLSNRGWGYLSGKKVPIVGRISMDSTVFDITEVARVREVEVGSSIEILGKHVSVDDLAKAASTISYEILTSFGFRYERCYLE